MHKTILLSCAIVLSLAPLSVLAEDSSPTPTATSTQDLKVRTNLKGEKDTIRPSGLTTGLPERSDAARGKKLQTELVKELTRRIDALNAALTKINNSENLPAATKTDLSARIQGLISNYTDLKQKAQTAGTDLPTLRTDVQSITKSYSVYAVLNPMMHLYGATANLKTAIERMDNIVTRLDGEIKAAKAKGQDVTALEANLADMKTKIADAQKQYDAAIAALATIKLDGDLQENKKQLKAVREDLRTARKDLVDARHDAILIITALKGASASPQPSASTTTTTSPSPTATATTPAAPLGH